LTNQKYVREWLGDADKLAEADGDGEDRWDTLLEDICQNSVQCFHAYITLFASLTLSPDEMANCEEDREDALSFTNGWRMFTLGERTQRVSELSYVSDVERAVSELQRSQTERQIHIPGKALLDRATGVQKSFKVRSVAVVGAMLHCLHCSESECYLA